MLGGDGWHAIKTKHPKGIRPQLKMVTKGGGNMKIGHNGIDKIGSGIGIRNDSFVAHKRIIKRYIFESNIPFVWSFGMDGGVH